MEGRSHEWARPFGIFRPVVTNPLGEALNWNGALPPVLQALHGRSVRLEAVDVEAHYSSLMEAAMGDESIWNYLPHGPFDDGESFRTWLQWAYRSSDYMFHVIIDERTGRAEGMASYMRDVPAHGVIEIGYIWFSPRLQRTIAATEAIFLLLAHVFDDLGYRRIEWKCNSLNRASRRAAERFGFTYEGIFRQHMVIKGRNRDTAWYAMLDREWPAIRRAFEIWLSPSNFDLHGNQRQSLSTIREREV
ncbi:MAG: GNAT family protein [Chloroflexota bacterium]